MNRRELSTVLPALALAGAVSPRRGLAQGPRGGGMLEWTAVQAIAAMKAGDVTAEAYANALLAQCERLKGLNAFITLDPDKVREAARAADRVRTGRLPMGLLHGLPIPVKDSVNTFDLPTTAGTPALRGHRPIRDAAVVARLRAAGALVLGKTNLHELSFGWTSNNGAFGAVHNPYDPTRIPGGSSGGTAAAIAARMAPLGVAEDTQGSVRVPAALCGVCGFRPTTGRYSSAGTAPITPVFDQVGPHARSVADLALFDAVVTAETGRIAPARLRGLRLGLVRGFHFAGLDPETARVVEAAIDKLKDAGVDFVEGELPGLSDLTGRITGNMQFHDVGPAFAAWLSAGGSDLTWAQVVEKASPDVRGIVARTLPGAAGGVTDEAYAAARDTHRPALQKLYADFFRDKGVAAIFLPATLTTAPPIGQTGQIAFEGGGTGGFSAAVSRNITGGSTAGLPGLVIPAGLSKGGLPVSIELDGPAGSDRTLLGVGMAVESVLGRLPGPRLAPQ